MANTTVTLTLTNKEFDLLTTVLNEALVDLEVHQARFLSLTRGMRRRRGKTGPGFYEARLERVQALLDRLTE